MQPEERFARYRRDRNPEDLGIVFDQVADDLYAVALHLCRDHAAADDLVQATFLVAIERVHRYDPGRPLRPWLLGILQQEARVLRRRARRQPDPARLAPRREPTSAQLALGAETFAVVRAAVTRLPAPYRDVVELHLVHELDHGAIAARLQRSAGAVRTQVWRGLELLRRLLPPGLAVGVAADLLAGPRIAMVREHVLAAALTRSTAVATGAVTGIWIMSKTKFVVAALAVGLGGWFLWPDIAGAPPAAHGDGGVHVIAATAPFSEQPHELHRDQVQAGDQPAAMPEPEPGADARDAPPRERNLLVTVVDLSGKPVAEATVSVHRPVAASRAIFDPAAPALELRTDTAGEVQIAIAGDTCVAARAAALGFSGFVHIRGNLRLKPLRLVLQPAAHLDVTVTDVDGSPIVGARVHCSSGDSDQADLVGASDADGRLSFEVRGGGIYDFYGLRAEHLDQHCRTTSVVPPGERRAVALRFPGAFALRGTLFDEQGAPLVGTIELDQHEPNGNVRRVHAGKTDDQGRFSVQLAAGGEFVIWGGTKGRTAAHAFASLRDEQPIVDVVLRTQPFVPIAGRIVDEHGEPIGGMRIGVDSRQRLPVAGQPAGTNWNHGGPRMEGGELTCTSGADGTFAMSVPAGVRYGLCYVLTKRFYVHSQVVTPPAGHVLIVARAADQVGFRIEGRVFDAHGAALAGCQVELREHHDSGGSSSGHEVTTGGEGRFAIGPLPTGRRYSLRLEAEGHGNCELGPFTSTGRTEQVTANMPLTGSLQVTVLRADGSPAAGAHVGIQRTGDHPFDPTPQGSTDRNGQITFEGLTPTEWIVRSTVGKFVTGGARAEGRVHVPAGGMAVIRLHYQQ